MAVVVVVVAVVRVQYYVVMVSVEAARCSVRSAAHRKIHEFKEQT
jgi:hypothetical protein